MVCLILLLISLVMAEQVSGKDESCPAIYMRYSKIHTFCRPKNLKCNILKNSVSPSDVGIILHHHNNYRSSFASKNRGKLPKASNMMEMVWDTELAAVAQKHANQCDYNHDCNNCRRVRDFQVGQNLGIDYVTNSKYIPEPNWPRVIKAWFDEIEYFQTNAIDPFIPVEKYGHFTQVVWAETWRIGCGHVLFKEGRTYKNLYVCNYGPAGNINRGSMYKQGQPCSKCPENSCCDRTCGKYFKYPGLCKITDNKAPVYKPNHAYFFFCNFQNQADCKISSTTGRNRWQIYKTLSGNFMGITLKGGEENSMILVNKLKPKKDKFCFAIVYRKGPNKDGEEENNSAIATMKINGYDFKINRVLPNFSGSLRNTFNRFSLNLNWKLETEIKITFSVPRGKPDQFLEIKEIYAHDGPC